MRNPVRAIITLRIHEPSPLGRVIEATRLLRGAMAHERVRVAQRGEPLRFEGLGIQPLGQVQAFELLGTDSPATAQQLQQ